MSGRDRRYVLYRDDDTARRAALAVTLLTAAVLLAPLWPLVLAALGTLAAAWLLGLHPARVFRAAAWSAPVAGAYLAAAALQAYRIGKHLRWRETDVLTWIDSHPA